jgi:hypothetical protein
MNVLLAPGKCISNTYVVNDRTLSCMIRRNVIMSPSRYLQIFTHKRLHHSLESATCFAFSHEHFPQL